MPSINFIKKISEKDVDEATHRKFVRYGIGDYEKEAFIVKAGSSIQIQAGYEYIDIMFRLLAALVSSDVHLDGLIVTTKDISKDLKAMDITPSKVTGKKYTMKITLDPKKFREFVDKFSQYFMLFSLKSGNYEMKMKKAVPKPGKLVEKFLTIKLPRSDYGLIKTEFFFDYDGDFKAATIKHTYMIEKIEVPKQYENDPEMARLHSKRIGKIKRIIEADGKSIQKEIPLNA